MDSTAREGSKPMCWRSAAIFLGSSRPASSWLPPLSHSISHSYIFNLICTGFSQLWLPGFIVVHGPTTGSCPARGPTLMRAQPTDSDHGGRPGRAPSSAGASSERSPQWRNICPPINVRIRPALQKCGLGATQNSFPKTPALL